MRLDAHLIEKMDASLAAYWGGYALAEDSEFQELRGALCFYTPIPLFLFNSINLTDTDLGTVDAAIGSAAQFVAARGTPVLWRLNANAASDAVKAQLEQAGLQPEGRDPAMLKDLSDLPPAPQVDGLTVKAVEGRSGRYDWAWLASDAFELGAEVREAMSRCEAAIPGNKFASQPRFIGYLDDKPVAVSSLVMTDDLAGIYAVATLPEARRRGIGTVMTLHAMAEGRRRGAKSAVLQATEMGRPVYEGIGFSTVFDYELYLQS